MLSHAQRAGFARYRREYNEERPHEALGQKPPASLSVPSPRPCPRVLPPLPDYPDDWAARKVRPCGAIKWGGREVRVSEALSSGTARTVQDNPDDPRKLSERAASNTGWKCYRCSWSLMP